MRCCRCNRPMTEPAATVQTRGALRFFGPKCARAAGLFKPDRLRVVVPSKGRAEDVRQADWVEEVAV